MYYKSKLSGKIYLNDVEIIQDDRLTEWQDMRAWILNGGEFTEVESTESELIELSKPVIPVSISRMNLKIVLLLRGITLQDIIDTINSIPDSMFSLIDKQIAIIKFNEAVSFDRYNADLNLVGVLMGLTQTDLDDIFINGNNL